MHRPHPETFHIAPTVAAAGGATAILCPGLARLPVGQAEIAALLPLADMNGAALAGCHGVPEGTVLALMLADPFLDAARVADTLRRAGITRVTNFPTVQLFEGDSARALHSAGLGTARELAMLARLQQSGFDMLGFAQGVGTARQLLDIGASAVVLHPGVALRDWRPRAASALRLEQDLARLQAETARPVHILHPQGYGTELANAAARAAGVVRLTA